MTQKFKDHYLAFFLASIFLIPPLIYANLWLIKILHEVMKHFQILQFQIETTINSVVIISSQVLIVVLWFSLVFAIPVWFISLAGVVLFLAKTLRDGIVKKKRYQ